MSALNSALCAFVVLASVCSSGVVWAQSTNSDWGGNAQFRSTNDQATMLNQADMQKRASTGYYQSYGTNYYTTNNITTTTSTTIGALNKVQVGSNASNVSVVSGAKNTGCGDASIMIGSGPAVKSCGGQ